MILLLAFLAVTNLALGFALAVYLLRTGEFPVRLLPPHITTLRLVARPATPPAPADDADEDARTNEAEQERPTESPRHADDEDETPAVEEDVLAGIEAFRAQLAQMNEEAPPAGAAANEKPAASSA